MGNKREYWTEVGGQRSEDGVPNAEMRACKYVRISEAHTPWRARLIRPAEIAEVGEGERL